MALTWAAEKFQEYILGIEVTLETDHKPLIQVLQTKALDSLTPRLRSFRLRLSNFNYHVNYIRGKDLVIADCLSRAPIPEKI